MSLIRGHLYDLNGDLVRFKMFRGSPIADHQACYTLRCPAASYNPDRCENACVAHGWAVFEILAADRLSAISDWIRVRKTNSIYYRNLFYLRSTNYKPLSKKSILLYVSRKIKSEFFINLLKGARQ